MKGLEYFRVQSNIAFDNDLEFVSDAAFRTFIEMLGIAAYDLSDGVMTYSRLTKLCNTPDVAGAVDELEAGGYIVCKADDVRIKNFKDYQRSRKETLDLREKNRDHVRTYREKCKPLHSDYSGEQSKSKRESKNTPPIVPPLGDFDVWYQLYPRKVARAAAEKAWVKATKKVKQEQIIAGLERQLPALKGKDKEYIPHPATWLNQERWDDEVASPSVPQSRAYVEFKPPSDDEIEELERLADFGRQDAK